MPINIKTYMKLADASKYKNVCTYTLSHSLSLSFIVQLPYSDFGLTNDVSMKQLATDAAANAFDYVLHVG
jgi:hypothetical protein